MKRKLTVLLAMVLTMTMTMPVFAQEVTDPKTVIKKETFTSGEDALANEFHNSQIWRSENYVKYLDGVIFNLNETVRIKKEVVTNYIWLSQFNPEFRNKIPQAQKELDEAIAWVNAYKEYKKAVQTDLKSKYNY